MGLTDVKDLIDWIQSAGTLGPLFFIAVYILTCIFLVPGFLLTYAGGFLFGPLKGTLIVSFSVTCGAALAFILGRTLLRQRIAAKVSANDRLRSLDEAVNREGWRVVVLARLCPFIPFRLSNYAFGLSGIRFREYLPATWLGTLPSAAFYVYIGSLFSDAQDLHFLRERTAAEWVFAGVGLAMLGLNLWYFSRLAGRALNNKLDR